MKLDITKEWVLRKAREEGDLDVGAGPIAIDPSLHRVEAVKITDLEPRIAFGTLVELMRRRLGLSVRKLAEEAQIEPSEIFSIERDAHYRPEPRTVYQLAGVFRLPSKHLLQLSGNVVVKDARIRDEAVRFAARSSKSVQELSQEEQQALEDFVKFLSRE